MHRHVIAHGQNFSGGIEYGAGIVATLLDVRRERGAAQRRAHFFRDRVEDVFENLEFDGIARHGWKKSTTTEAMGRLKVKLHRQNCVDIQNNTPQYLGVRVSFTLEV